jgi:hypothetical protein
MDGVRVFVMRYKSELGEAASRDHAIPSCVFHADAAALFYELSIPEIDY